MFDNLEQPDIPMRLRLERVIYPGTRHTAISKRGVDEGRDGTKGRGEIGSYLAREMPHRLYVPSCPSTDVGAVREQHLETAGIGNVSRRNCEDGYTNHACGRYVLERM